MRLEHVLEPNAHRRVRLRVLHGSAAEVCFSRAANQGICR